MNMRNTPQISNMDTHSDTSNHSDDAESELENKLNHKGMENET